MTRVYGWKPDLPDKRDQYVQLDYAIVDATTLPLTYSMRDKMPPVWNQGSLGACTAFALGGAMLSKHWRVDADGSIDASVQLRRDVGKLVRAARELSRFVKEREIEGNKLAQKVGDVDAAVELFAGDYV
jgi:hypothetical protein